MNLWPNGYTPWAVQPKAAGRVVSLGTSDSKVAVEGREHMGPKVATLAPGRRRRTPARGRGTDCHPAERGVHGDGGRAGPPPCRARQRLQRPDRRAVLRHGQGRHGHVVRRRPGGHRDGACQGPISDAPDHRGGDRRWRSAAPEKARPAGAQLRHPKRDRGGEASLCARGDHARRQLVVIVHRTSTTRRFPRSRPDSRRSTTSRRGWPMSRVPRVQVLPVRARPTPSATSGSTPPMTGPSTSRPRSAPATSCWSPTAGTARPWPPPATTCTTSTSWPGPGRVRDWLISDDPHHGWVRQTWDSQNLDPRLPFGA